MALTLGGNIILDVPGFIGKVKDRLIRNKDADYNGLEILHGLSEGLKGHEFILTRYQMNDLYDINTHLAALNAQLDKGQYLIGCASHLRGYQSPLFYKGSTLPRITLRHLSFLVHRVLPKLPYSKKIYNWATGGKTKRMCKTEILGRLAYAGFRIEKVREEGPQLFYRVIKTSNPLEGYQPTFGPLIRLKRVVKDGKIVKIYKLRTMHPYAEFIQDYVYEQNDLDTGGKIKDDFRVSEEGRVFRKLFLDELPMLINLLRGDIKLVGVRPLSQHYFSLYTEAMQRRRIKHKPGLLPPFYSEEEKPSTLEDVMVSEMKYLIEYEKHPWKTDVKYFVRILDNLIRKKLRSK